MSQHGPEEKQVRREYTCTVTGFKMLTPTVFETTFEPKAADGDILPDFRPGQFISIIVPGAGPKGRDLRHAYSIASEPKTRPIELCIKLVEGGPGTNYLYTLRPGDTFRGVAPYGDFVYKTPSSRHSCFISTGTGIAPFRSMVLSETFRKNPPLSATLMLGVRDEAELMYMEELGSLKGVRWVPCVSR